MAEIDNRREFELLAELLVNLTLAIGRHRTLKILLMRLVKRTPEFSDTVIAATLRAILEAIPPEPEDLTVPPGASSH